MELREFADDVIRKIKSLEEISRDIVRRNPDLKDTLVAQEFGSVTTCQRIIRIIQDNLSKTQV